MKLKKIIITAWMLEVTGYSIWIEVQKWINFFNNLGYKVELVHGRDKRYPFLGRENKKLLDLQKQLFLKKISWEVFIKNPLVVDIYQKTFALFEKKWEKEKFILVAENVFGPALNIPYSKGLFDVINKFKIPTIARIHDFYVDFYTKKDQKIKDTIPDLKNIFECNSENIHKVFISKFDYLEARKRKLKNLNFLPNSFTFQNYSKINQKNISSIKNKLSIKTSDLIFLQPTRILTRKRIEDMLYLLSIIKKKINKKIKFIISGGFKEYNPETVRYIKKIINQAKEYDISLYILIDLDIKYQIQDVYHIADFITLLSSEEGFGLPVIESCVYKKPLIVRRYPKFGIFENLSQGRLILIKTSNPKHPWNWTEKQKNNFINEILLWIKMPSEKREKILQKNYIIVKKNFSSEYILLRLKKILQKIQDNY